MAAFIVVDLFPFFFSLLLFFDCLFSVCVFLLYVSLHIFGYCSVATFQIHTQLGLIQFQYERPGGRRAKKKVSALCERTFLPIFFFISGNRRFMITKKVFFFPFDWAISVVTFFFFFNRKKTFDVFIPLCRFVGGFSPYFCFPCMFSRLCGR